MTDAPPIEDLAALADTYRARILTAARRALHRAPQPIQATIEHGDLVQAAYVGLMTAAHSWNGASAFNGWAWMWIRSELHKELYRRGSPVKVTRGGCVQRWEVIAEDHEIAAPMCGLDYDVVRALAGMGVAIGDLTQREARVIRLMLDEWAPGEIAAEMGITLHRVGQLRRAACGKLRAALAWYGGD